MHLQEDEHPCNPIQTRACHIPDTYLICVNPRAAGFGEGFGKASHSRIICRGVVSRYPAKL
jgi:hypothetical protein